MTYLLEIGLSKFRLLWTQKKSFKWELCSCSFWSCLKTKLKIVFPKPFLLAFRSVLIHGFGELWGQSLDPVMIELGLNLKPLWIVD